MVINRGHLSREGFTLIELLIAVLVVGILAAIALPAFNKQRERAKDSAAQQSLEAGLRAAKAIYADGESFPASGLGTLFSRAERSQSFADGATFPAAGTINVERSSASRVVLRTTSRSGNQHMLSLEEPDSKVLRFAPPATAATGTLPSLTNALLNPSFEVNTASWRSDSCLSSCNVPVTRSTDAVVGNYSAEITDPAVGTYTTSYIVPSAVPAASPPYLSVTPGQRVEAAGWVKYVSASVQPTYVAVQLRWHAADGSYVGENNVGTQNTPQAGRWYRLRGGRDAPAGAVLATLGARVAVGTGPSVTWRVDGLQLGLGENSTYGYVDGDQAGASWSGVAHNSTSTGPGSSSSW